MPSSESEYSDCESERSGGEACWMKAIPGASPNLTVIHEDG